MARGQFMILIDAVDAADEVDDAILGGWLRLCRYCAGKLNGGRIVACKAWSDRQWLKAARIDRRRVEEVVESELAAWDGQDLVLARYDIKGDHIYAKQRDEGHRRAAARWGRSPDEDTNQGESGRSPTKETKVGDSVGQLDGQGGGKASLGDSRSVVSSENLARETTPTSFSPGGPAPTWAAKHRDLIEPMIAQFSDPQARIIDVLRFFRVMFEVRGEPLEGEWERETKGQQTCEVALVFMHSAEGSIRLPGKHYRPARRALETTEMAS